MKLSELISETAKINRSKGWHEGPQPNFSDLTALTISELAEALEDHRVSKDPASIEFVKKDSPVVTYSFHAASTDTAWTGKMIALRTAHVLIESGHKPNGIVIELADVVIRICDCMDRQGWSFPGEDVDLAFLCASAAATRDSFGVWFCDIAHCLIWARDMEAEPIPEDVDPDFVPTAPELMFDALELTCQFVNWLGLTGDEFETAIAIKQAYNRTRPHRHGGKAL